MGEVKRLRPRQEYRQHSKSTLLRATETLFRERAIVVTVEARKWRRRLVWAASGAFLGGAWLGAAVCRLLLSY